MNGKYRKRNYKRNRKRTRKSGTGFGSSKLSQVPGQVVSTTHRKRLTISRLPKSEPADMVILPFNYSETITISGISGAMGDYVYRINSLYDPNYTGTGVQPLYYDQWTYMYSNYLVNAVAYELTYYTANTVPSQLCVLMARAPTISGMTNITDVTTKNMASKIILITPDNSTALAKGYAKINAIMGVNKKEYADNPEIYGAVYNANPTEPAYMHILAQAMDYTSSISITLNVRLKFYCQLNQLQEAITAS